MTVTTIGTTMRQRWASRTGLRRWGGEALSWFAILLLAVAVTALVGVAVAPRLFGWNFVVVAGGSMEPAIQFGSVAVMEEVKPADLQMRDIVMFREPNGKVVTHRIVAISDDHRTLTTQGDANNVADQGLVPVTSVQGRYRFSVPEVGRFVRWMGTREGYMALIFIPGMAIIALELVSVGKTLRGKNRTNP